MPTSFERRFYVFDVKTLLLYNGLVREQARPSAFFLRLTNPRAKQERP